MAFNQLKKEHSLVATEAAAGVEARARVAMDLIKAIDNIVDKHGLDNEEMLPLKQEVDRLSVSSICQKKEMHWPAASFVRNAPRIFWAIAKGSACRYGA
jgi:hypothetical protein